MGDTAGTAGHDGRSRNPFSDDGDESLRSRSHNLRRIISSQSSIIVASFLKKPKFLRVPKKVNKFITIILNDQKPISKHVILERIQ